MTLKNWKKWSEINWMKFNKDTCKVRDLRWNNQMHVYTLVNDWSGCSTADKALGIIVDHKLNMIQHHVTAAKQINSILGYINRSGSWKSREVILLLYSNWWGLIWSIAPSFEYCPSRIEKLETIQQRTPKWFEALEIQFRKERLEELGWLFSLKKRKMKENLITVIAISLSPRVDTTINQQKLSLLMKSNM